VISMRRQGNREVADERVLESGKFVEQVIEEADKRVKHLFSRQSEQKVVEEVIKRFPFTISEVVSGGAAGVDHIGEKWAIKNKIPIKFFIPEWKKFGKKAGPLRNIQMADYADALVAIWDGESRGTWHMINEMKKRNKLILSHKTNG